MSFFKVYLRSLAAGKALLSCRYTGFSYTVTLPDGRKLGYAQYGTLAGKPILYLHGMPGIRTEASSLEPYARKHGARVIAIDRPGYGFSTPHPNYTVLDHAKDVEYLANHLRLKQYGILSISGGGPYALACAKSLPADKLKVVSIVCGIGPSDGSYTRVDWLRYLLFKVHWPVFGLFKRLCYAKNPAYCRKTTAWFNDGRRIMSNHGFRVEDIRKDLPFQLWYGSRDVSVSLNHGRQIAARLGPIAQLRVEDETHATICDNWEDEIVTELVDVLR